jgi:chromosome segregation ATPase
MDPITLAILAAVGGSLLGGGTAYAATKAASQKRVKELQDQVRQLQRELQRKQKIVAELQSELAAVQAKLAERENRIAELLEREANLLQRVQQLGAQIRQNSRLWRRVVAMLLFRYGQLVSETERLVTELEGAHGQSSRSAELRATLELERAKLAEAKQALSGQLSGAEEDIAALRSKRAEVDTELTKLLAA